MSFFDDSHHDGVMNDINMTPLIDVMLVLLIVFMVTLPVLPQAVKLDLPSVNSQPVTEQSKPVSVSIDATGALYWDNRIVAAEDLQAKLTQAAQQHRQPDIALYADRAVRYEAVADFLGAAQRSGLSNINFVTQPKDH